MHAQIIGGGMTSWLLAQSTMPNFDGWYFLLLTSRVLHILGSIVLLGGIFYLLAIVAPRAVASGGDADAWFNGNRAGWAKWVGIATAVLLVTGLFNFVTIIKTNHLAMSYHMLGTLKILAALCTLFLRSNPRRKIIAGGNVIAKG